ADGDGDRRRDAVRAARRSARLDRRRGHAPPADHPWRREPQLEGDLDAAPPVGAARRAGRRGPREPGGATREPGLADQNVKHLNRSTMSESASRGGAGGPPEAPGEAAW